MVEDHLLHLLVDLLLLPKNHITLPLNRGIVQFRVLEDVADDVDRLSNVFAEALRVVDGLLPGGVRVQVRTKVLDLQLESMLTPLVGTLEGHMFQEVSRAVGFVCLCARAGIDPDTNGSRLCVRM